jgi:hypothetical protein
MHEIASPRPSAGSTKRISMCDAPAGTGTARRTQSAGHTGASRPSTRARQPG